MQLELSRHSNINSLIEKIIYKDFNFSLSFRPLQEEHSELMHNAVIESFENLKKFMDWSHRNLSAESQLTRIKNCRINYLAKLEYDFSVFDQKTNEFLMSASLSRSRVPNKRALNIGYWTSSKHCNQGLATITTKILTVLAFEYLNCDRVEIGCNKANQSSLRVIAKCSFNFEGESKNYFSEPTIDMIKNGYCSERSCLHYSLIKEELQQISWFQEVKNNLTVDYL